MWYCFLYIYIYMIKDLHRTLKYFINTRAASTMMGWNESPAETHVLQQVTERPPFVQQERKRSWGGLAFAILFKCHKALSLFLVGIAIISGMVWAVSLLMDSRFAVPLFSQLDRWPIYKILKHTLCLQIVFFCMLSFFHCVGIVTRQFS